MIDERKSGGAASFTIEDGLVGDSPPMRALADRIDRVARSALPVLVRGETGSGKELVARAIHRRSRRTGAFVSENCAALADSLLEAELFGHEQGAFTGADRARDGLFARAHGGTLFIDEVGDMSPAMQAKLLRVLQDGEVRRLGGQRTRTFDVRVIAATHKDLEALVRQGLFREDLLFRLAVLEVRVPALRDRPEDLPGLVEHFLRRQAAETGQPPLLLSDQTLDALMAHAWPGNVRELEHVISRAALKALSRGARRTDIVTLEPVLLDLDAMDLAAARIADRSTAGADADMPRIAPLRDMMQAAQRQAIRDALAASSGNWSQAARQLKVDASNLHKLAQRLGMKMQ
ncbi:MAG: sigma 54-interacting transcriptional regulator [Burkholderiales bacterium]|nr:sigma 54-interacting transcriptional regulator [Burkholderiales bacterium]